MTIKLSELYEKNFKIVKGQSGFNFIKLAPLWPEIMGEKISEKTHPLKIKDASLYILTENSSLSHQLYFLESHILEKIYGIFPHYKSKITSLKFKVSKRNLEELKKIKTQKEEKKPQKNSNRPHLYNPSLSQFWKEASEIFSDIEDQELKKTFMYLYVESKVASLK